VPVVSALFGIIIRMFYKEHEPAHFHAEHRGQHAKFDFSGELPIDEIQSRTAARLIREGAIAHRAELAMMNWARMKEGQPTRPDSSLGVV
jgi:hypothetical protein